MKQLLILLSFLMATALAQPPVRFIQGTGAPTAGACNASTAPGAIYVRYDNPATNPSQVYVCSQTGASSWSWQFISHKTGSSAPAKCDVGEVFFNSSSTAGLNWYGCTAADTWTQMSGSGTPSGSSGDLQRNNSGAFGAANMNQNADGSINASKAVTYPTPSAPTFNGGGTTTCDWSASNACGFTMTGNTTLALSNPHGSGPYFLIPTMDGTGNRTITYPGSVAVAPQPSGTANVKSTIMCLYDGSANYYCFFLGSTDAGGSIVLPGSTSGTLTVKSAAVAGTNTLTLPAGTTDLSATGGTSQVLKQTSSGSALTVARLVCSDLSDSGAGCSSAAGPFTDFQKTTSAISMTGSDVAVYTTTSAPALAAGKCYRIEGNVVSSLAGGGTFKLKAGTTVIATLYASADHVQFVVLYCNNPSVQNVQQTSYVMPIQYLPASGFGISGAGFVNSSTDSQVFAPTTVDWSTTHDLSLTVNAASGTATGGYWHITQQ